MRKPNTHRRVRQAQGEFRPPAGTGGGSSPAIPFLLVAAAIAAFANIFSVPFIFDDRGSILGNPGIRHLWPLWPALWAPPEMAISGRPIVSLSFALNYAVGGYQVQGYHAFNLFIHILNSLMIFAIARRSLAPEQERLGGEIRTDWLAGGAALIWTVHPLLSESVTYTMQRTELLMALFLLSTIYSVLRAAETPGHSVWPVAAILSSALGMGCKEVMAAAPALTLLYDRIFLSASFRQIFRLRGRLYAGLCSTWLILGALLATGPRTKSVGLGFQSIGPWEYLLTQAGVINHYIRLALFPHPLCIDYSDWPIARTLTAALPAAGAIVALLAASAWALVRMPKLGFLGAWFFLILAPSSSIIPIVTEPAAERRMYLPLLSLIFLAVLGVNRLAGTMTNASRRRWIEAALLASTAFAFILVTSQRNEAYSSETTIWADAAGRRPNNARALNNLGSALAREGRSDEALPLFAKALVIDPNYPEAHNNLGGAYYNKGRMPEAILQFSEAVRLNPDYGEAHLNLGLALHNRGRLDEAIGHYREALRLSPGDAEAHNHLGAALLGRGRPQEAIEHFREALRLRPGYTEARRNLENAPPAGSTERQ